MKIYAKNFISIVIFLGLSVGTVVVLLSMANEKDIENTNEQLSAIKLREGAEYFELDNPEVRKILGQDTQYMDEYFYYAGGLVVIYFIIFLFYLRRTNGRSGVRIGKSSWGKKP